MSYKIFKYPLEGSFKIPSVNKLLKVDLDYKGWPSAWFLVDTDSLEQLYKVHIFGTGWEVPEDLLETYLGTVSISKYTWHYFAEISNEVLSN